MRSAKFLLAGLLLPPPASAAETDTLPARRVEEVVAVLQGTRAAGETFDTRFLAEVPPEKIAALVAQIEATSGKVIGADQVKADSASTITFRIRFERATAMGRMTLDAAPLRKVGGFWISSIVPTGDNAARIAADFAALPGRAGFAVVRLGVDPVTLAAARDGEQFAIGSAFKLWVLDALAEEIAGGRLTWDQVVRLGPRSLPSGIMQDWPDGAAVTVETLATLMISRSDNTATDTLIGLIGRDRIAERVRASGHSDPSRLLPLMTTAEAFALKLSPPDRREAYAKAGDAEQARILASLDPHSIIAAGDASTLASLPIAIDGIEWFASPTDMARLLDGLRRRTDPKVVGILAVAPSLPPDMCEHFAYVGFKGGSELGVLNLTWLLRDKAGAWFAVSASWNDAEKPVDEAQLGQLAQRLIRLIS